MGSSAPPKILTALQERFLGAFFARTQAFWLTGGTALSAFYLRHRLSRDLDLFTLDDRAMADAGRTVGDAARSLGLSLSEIQTTPTFRRALVVDPAGDQVLIDLARDADYQVEPRKPSAGPIRYDSLPDLCCNKLCTLLGRREVRDYVDVYFLDRSGTRIADHLDLARNKDGGLDPALLAHLLKDFTLTESPAFMVEPVSPQDVTRFFKTLSADLLKRAFPSRPT